MLWVVSSYFLCLQLPILNDSRGKDSSFAQNVPFERFHNFIPAKSLRFQLITIGSAQDSFIISFQRSKFLSFSKAATEVNWLIELEAKIYRQTFHEHSKQCLSTKRFVIDRMTRMKKKSNACFETKLISCFVEYQRIILQLFLKC